MPNNVELTSNFKSEAKPLIKKYHSLKSELKALEIELIENPKLGDKLSEDIYKIKLAVKSKGKGKSGGLRIISFIYTFDESSNTIFLLSIYNKSEFSTVDTNVIKRIVEQLKKELSKDKLTATWKKHTLIFKQASGTSRGVLKTKDSYFILVENKEKPNKTYIGECGILRGLSIDDRPDYEEKLSEVCENINQYLSYSSNQQANLESLKEFPSIQIGLEIAQLELNATKPHILFPSVFTEGTKQQNINGLIWMGTADFMKQQIKEKLSAGFSCIKMKIGAIDFETEISLLKSIRSEFSASEIELRVDANGAFSPANALEKLKRLSELELHSIEQPIKQKQWQEMANLCEKTPLPIALDEELIGIFDESDKIKCLETIKPQYIILKPSFIGGFAGADNWIALAEERNIGWWATSALESNIGLNAIAQWTFTKNNPMPQGLGTGKLYTNNFESPLYIKNGQIGYNENKNWNIELLKKV